MKTKLSDLLAAAATAAAVLFLLFSFAAPPAAAQTAAGSGRVAAATENGKDFPEAGHAAARRRALDIEQAVFALVNRVRAEKNRAPLAWNNALAEAARNHAENMSRFDFFSHAGRDGSMVDERVATQKIEGWQALGENIAYNRGYIDPAEAAVEKWLLSPAHRDNLLGAAWQQTGIGVALKPDGTVYFTQIFLKK